MKPGEEIKKKLIEETESRPKKGEGEEWVGGWWWREGKTSFPSPSSFSERSEVSANSAAAATKLIISA